MNRYKNDEDLLWDMIHEAQFEVFKANFFLTYWEKQVENPVVTGIEEAKRHVKEFKDWIGQQEDKIKQLEALGKSRGLI